MDKRDKAALGLGVGAAGTGGAAAWQFGQRRTTTKNVLTPHKNPRYADNRAKYEVKHLRNEKDMPSTHLFRASSTHVEPSGWRHYALEGPDGWTGSASDSPNLGFRGRKYTSPKYIKAGARGRVLAGTSAGLGLAGGALYLAGRNRAARGAPSKDEGSTRGYAYSTKDARKRAELAQLWEKAGGRR